MWLFFYDTSGAFHSMKYPSLNSQKFPEANGIAFSEIEMKREQLCKVYKNFRVDIFFNGNFRSIRLSSRNFRKFRWNYSLFGNATIPVFFLKPLPGNVYAICPHFYSFGIFGWMEDALSSHWVQLSQHAKWHDNSFMSSLSRSTIPFKKCFIRPLTCSNGFHIKVLREHDVIILNSTCPVLGVGLLKSRLS